MTRKRQERKARQRQKLQEAGEQDGMDAADKPPRREIEIRAAGSAIDLPFEAPAPLKPGEGIRYADGKTLEDAHREAFPDFYKDRDDASSSET